MTEQKQKTKEKDATHYECVVSHSIFYTQGKIYPLIKNAEGEKGYICDKGYFDRRDMVASRFKATTKEAYDRRQKLMYDTVVTIRDDVTIEESLDK